MPAKTDLSCLAFADKAQKIHLQPGRILESPKRWAIREGHNNGWFVGYLEGGEQLYVFATNVDPTPEFDMRGFTQARKDVTLVGLKRLGFMPE